MNIKFERMNIIHASGVMKIINHYAENSTAIFLQGAAHDQLFGMLLKRSENYPSYTIIDEDNDKIIGFSQLSAYNPIPTFKKTACFTCFITPEYTRKGVGEKCLSKLEEEAKGKGIVNIIAEISDENEGSLRFHERHGFVKVGELKNIGEKLERSFGIIYMQKILSENIEA